MLYASDFNFMPNLRQRISVALGVMVVRAVVAAFLLHDKFRKPPEHGSSAAAKADLADAMSRLKATAIQGP